MKLALLRSLPALCLIMMVGPAAADTEQHVLRYLVTPVKLYDSNGVFKEKLLPEQLPPPPVLIVGKGAVGSTVAIKVGNDTFYLPPNEVLTDNSPCPVGTTLAAVKSGTHMAGEVAGAGGGDIRCTPTSSN